MYEDLFRERMADGMFRIDDDGAIWRQWRGEWRRAETLKHGYLMVRIYVPEGLRQGSRLGKRYPLRAHRLVYEHFRGPIDPGLVVNHINGVKTDNRPENLEAITAMENVMHWVREIGPMRGAEIPGAKLTDLKVAAIVALKKSSFTARQIGEIVGVQPGTIAKVLSGLSWRHVVR